jgi:Leucine-rich repeat (LRR) protein
MYLNEIAGDLTIIISLHFGRSERGIIPEDFARMVPNLESLTLNETITGRISGLEKLEQLNVYGGDVEFEGPMNALKNLNISCNHRPIDVSHLDKVAPNINLLELEQSGIMGNLPTFAMLRDLKIDGTQLTNLPNLPHLKKITLNGTKITQFTLTAELTHISLHRNAEFRMTADQFRADELRGLISLTVDSQPFDGVLPANPVLEDLSILRTTIRGIDDCPNLKKLSLTHNQSLTGGVDFFKKLSMQNLGEDHFNEQTEGILIDNCLSFFDHLTFLEIDFSRFRRLEYLFLINNQIDSSLPLKIAENTSIELLHINGNRFRNDPVFFKILGENMLSFGGRTSFELEIDLKDRDEEITQDLLRALFVAITLKIEQQRIHPTYEPVLTLPYDFFEQFGELPPEIATGTLDDQIIYLHQLLEASAPLVMGGLRRATRRQKRKNKKTKKKRKRSKKYSRY